VSVGGKESFGGGDEDFLALAAALAVSWDGVVDQREQRIVSSLMSQLVGANQDRIRELISLALETILLYEREEVLGFFYRVKEYQMKRRCLIVAAEAALCGKKNQRAGRELLTSLAAIMGVGAEEVSDIRKYCSWKYG
jgi:hypothetical protein